MSRRPFNQAAAFERAVEERRKVLVSGYRVIDAQYIHLGPDVSAARLKGHGISDIWAVVDIHGGKRLEFTVPATGGPLDISKIAREAALLELGPPPSPDKHS